MNTAETKVAAAPSIEIVKPAAPFVLDDERFDRGERVILVNGQRWGRTIVSSHGVHGLKYRFQQDEGDVIIRNPESRYPREVEVWSGRMAQRQAGGSRMFPKEIGTIEERLLAAVRDLVAAGKLRDPAIVRAEAEKFLEQYRAEQAAGEAREAAEFRSKALEAAGYTGEPNDPASRAMVDRIVEAMRWAQTK